MDLSAAPVYRIDLGSPIVADTNGVAESQSVSAGEAFVLDGVSVVNGVAVLDVPRALTGAWTTTSVLTATGTDVNGDVLVESSASGATYAGKKAFKTVTSVTSTASITSAIVGFGDVLGLPVFLPNGVYVLKELEDGAAPTAGTIVAGVTTAATATTGDVRGTYDPNSAANGAKAFALLAALPDPVGQGVPQYAGISLEERMAKKPKSKPRPGC